MSLSLKSKTIAGLMVLAMAGAGAGGLVTGAAAGLLVDTAQVRRAPAAISASAAPNTSPAPNLSSAPSVVNTSAPLPAPSAAAPTVGDLQAAVESVYAQANPSVVYIVVQSTVAGRGFGGYATQQASGSGFVYDSKGMIVTNAHVVDGAQQIEVVFADGSHQPANLVGEDTANDLAVIQVASLPASAKPLTLAANSVAVGEFVAAIGSPFGEQNSMSFGIVSGLGRSMTDSSASGRFARSTIGSALTDLIQTDAPINPGNSGGPLLDLSGQVVGVDNAIESSSGSSAGVGFAIPASVVRQVVPGLIANAG